MREFGGVPGIVGLWLSATAVDRPPFLPADHGSFVGIPLTPYSAPDLMLIIQLRRLRDALLGMI